MRSVADRAFRLREYSEDDPRVKKISRAVDTHGRKPDSLIQVLHTVQDIFGYLPMELIAYVSHELRVAPSRVFGVVTFYHYFSLKPKGEHNCLVCTGTACYVKGAQRILDELGRAFGIKPGEATADNRLGLQTARCIGSCGLAPAVVVDDEILAKVDPAGVAEQVRGRIGAKK
jgi:bidirectional [NiFe] hydrogenase diaphorase subunit